MSTLKSHTCTNVRGSRAAATLGAFAAAAMFLSPSAALAQTCSPTLGIEFVGLPPDTKFAVGQSFDVNVNFGAISVPTGGTMTINTLSLRLDCVPGTGCKPECVDAGALIAYDGDASIGFSCGSAVTSNNPGGGTGTNTIVFTFNPPLVLSANQSCDLQFGLTVNSLGVPASPKLITSRVSFLGDCSGTTLDALVCGTFEIPLVDPDIEIVKTACPTLVYNEGENVKYTYVVTTGDGNAPISNVVVTDNLCGPVTFVNGDDGDNVLEVGEAWVYTCTAFITQTTINTGTVNGEWIGNAGNVPVTDNDDALVQVFQINTIPGDCETTYVAKTDACAETCSWTGPGGFTASTCQITLGPGNAAGSYCVTVSCPGQLEEDCPHNCGQPGQPACAPRQATGCITFTPPVPPVVEVVGSPACEGSNGSLCAIITGPRAPFSVQWFQGATPVGAPCNVQNSGGQCCLPINPVVGVVYRAVAEDTNGCVDEDDGSVGSFPNRLVTVNDAQVCEDAPVPALCATVGGGTAPYSVVWYACVGGEPTGAPLSTPCIVANDGGQCCFTPESPGTYAAVAEDANGCVGDDCGTISTIPLPPCSIGDGPTSVCAGASEQYCGPAGMDSYSWSENSAACSISGSTTGQCVQVNFTSAGNCLLQLQVTDNTCTRNCELRVTVNPDPPCLINSGPDAVCIGAEEEYCGPAGLDSYQWSENSAACSIVGSTTAQCVTVSFTSAGNCLLLLAVVDDGCDSNCEKRVTVSGPPVCAINSGPAEICSGESAQYCGPAGMDSYLWSENSAACNISGSLTGQCVQVNFTAAGNCDLVLNIVDNGCPSNCNKRVLVNDCGGEGRTPGFWKQVHHFGHWPDQWCPSSSCGCTPTQFCAVFNCAGAGAGCTSAVNGAYANKTLLQVLSQGGGGFKALGRHAVAGLLNSGVDQNILDYAFSTEQVITMVNQAIATCNPGPAHQELASNNELEGGNLGGQSFCTDLNLDGAVNNNDLSIILTNWGKPGAGDIDGSGLVGPNDLSILLSNWGSY